MKSKKSLIIKIIYLSEIIFVTLFSMQKGSMIGYGNEVNDERTDTELRSVNRLWCNEHDVYEDECIVCRPELASSGADNPSVDLECSEHRVLERECGICRPGLIAPLALGHGMKIRLKSPESAARAGLTTIVPDNGSHLSTPAVLCRVVYNQNHLAHITPLASGVIQKVAADIGDVVSRGDVLAEIASPEIAKAKADYLTAMSNETLKETVFKREKGLFEKKISSQYECQQAVAEYHSAKNTTNIDRQQLLNYGFTEDEVQEIAETQSSSSVLLIRSPFQGTIIERNAVAGEATEPGKTLFSLADLSTMWLEISIPEDRFSIFKVGDPIAATFGNLAENNVEGRLIWLASGIDEESRMLKARAVVDNPNLLLKHGMFGQAWPMREQSSDGLYVPLDSIQRFDGNPFVFIKLSDDLYEVRRVALGGRNEGIVEILKGVSSREEVVAAHSFILKSESLKSRLGEGCADE